MKIVLFAYSDIGHDCLNYLLKSGEQVALLVTHPHNEASGLKTPETIAHQYGMPVIKMSNSSDLKDLIPLLKSLKPDVMLSVYFRYIIPESILEIAKLASLNMHGSFLPYYRGRCPVNWAIMRGAKETGVTLHHMVERVDAGDIVDQHKIPIHIEDTAGTVTQNLIQGSITLLARQLPLFHQGLVTRKALDITQGFYCRGRTAEDSRIDWHRSNIEIYNFIRALQPSPPYPAAFSDSNGKRFYFLKARIPFQDLYPPQQPGTIIEKNTDYVVIACGQKGEERLVVEHPHILKN